MLNLFVNICVNITKALDSKVFRVGRLYVLIYKTVSLCQRHKSKFVDSFFFFSNLFGITINKVREKLFTIVTELPCA